MTYEVYFVTMNLILAHVDKKTKHTCAAFFHSYHHPQDGTAGEDRLRGVSVQADTSILLAGYTAGDWDGMNAGGWDCTLVALLANREEVWRWQVIGGALYYFSQSRVLVSS